MNIKRIDTRTANQTNIRIDPNICHTLTLFLRSGGCGVHTSSDGVTLDVEEVSADILLITTDIDILFV